VLIALQDLAEHAVFGQIQLRVALEHRGCRAAHPLDDVEVRESRDMQRRESTLPEPEVVAGSTDPQVLFGQVEPVRGAHDSLQTLERLRRLVARDEEADARRVAAADAAAKLVKLGEAKALRALDYHDRGV